MTTEKSTKIISFIASGAGVLMLGRGYMSCSEMHYFFEILLLYSSAIFRQTKGLEMMTKKESTKIVNFKTPGAEVLIYWHDHTVKIQNFFSSSCLHWDKDLTN